MFVIHIVAPVEHLVVNTSKIRAEGSGELVVGGRLVVLAVAHFNLNVVVDTDAIGGSVILYRVDRQSADLDATHCALDFSLGDGTFNKAFGIVGLLIVGKRHFLWLLVLAEGHLLRIKRLDTKIGERINRGAVILHFDGDVTDTVGNSDKFVNDGQSRIAHVT